MDPDIGPITKENVAKNCDYCDCKAAGVRDGRVCCKRHLLGSVKEASDEVSLKNVSTHLADKHKK